MDEKRKRWLKMSDNIDGFLEDGKFNSDNVSDEKFTKTIDILIEMTKRKSDFLPATYKTRNIEIKYHWYADQHYYYVTNLKDQFLYIMTWYKGGSEVGCILFQGEIITKDDFDYFYKFLRKEYGKWNLEKFK